MIQQATLTWHGLNHSNSAIFFKDDFLDNNDYTSYHLLKKGPFYDSCVYSCQVVLNLDSNEPALADYKIDPVFVDEAELLFCSLLLRKRHDANIFEVIHTIFDDFFINDKLDYTNLDSSSLDVLDITSLFQNTLTKCFGPTSTLTTPIQHDKYLYDPRYRNIDMIHIKNNARQYLAACKQHTIDLQLQPSFETSVITL